MKVKLCGIRDIATGLAAARLGADYLGFVFYPPSPRYVEPGTVRDIVAAIPPEVTPVGVFVNTPVADVRQTAEYCGLRAVQLHGSNSLPEDLAALAPLAPIKALALNTAADLAAAARYGDYCLLLDTPCEGYGGSGRTGNWSLAARCARRYKVILAGGLTPDNVAAAIRAVHPSGVDVSSGVETCPGSKDLAEIERFIAAAREAAAAVTAGPAESDAP